MEDIVINFPEDSEADDCSYNDNDCEDFGDEIYED